MFRFFSVVFALLLAVSHSCADEPQPAALTTPPADLVKNLKLSPFYKKYIDAQGLPVLGSEKVSDAALREAVEIVNHMLDGRDDVRKAIIRNKIRVAIMAPSEQTVDIPEHSDLTPKDYWNARARGLGATLARPAVSGAEENLLNLRGDRYAKENILVHEFGHTFHEMGLNSIDRGFDQKLQDAYAAAKKKGLWKGHYAQTNHKEYWAEGVQSYFDTNVAEADTREKLAKYDPDLFALIDAEFRQSKWRYVRYDKRNPRPPPK